jgi:hypothetical protein
LRYPEQCFGAIKKTGKSGLAAAHVLATTLLFGGRYAEAYCIANDLEQAVGRVYQAIRRICESSPHLQRDCDITQSRNRCRHSSGRRRLCQHCRCRADN